MRYKKEEKRRENLHLLISLYYIRRENISRIRIVYLFVKSRQKKKKKRKDREERGEREREREKKENDSLYTEIFRPTRFHRSTTTTGNESFHLRILAFGKATMCKETLR